MSGTDKNDRHIMLKSDVKRDQILQAEAEAKSSKLTPGVAKISALRPRPERRGRGQNRR